MPAKRKTSNIRRVAANTARTEAIRATLDQRQESGASSGNNGESSKTKDFLRMNPSVFTGTKKDEDPQDYIDALKKIFRVITVTETEATTFGAHPLQGIDHFMPIEVRKAKAEQFLKLKQNGKSVQDYYLEFVSLAKHAPLMIPNMRARVRRFVYVLDPHLYDGANIALQNGEMTISKMVAFAIVGQKTYDIPSCNKCGKRHPGECRMGMDVCYGCGQWDHFQRDCPSARQGTRGNVAQSTNSAAFRNNQAQQGHNTAKPGNADGGRTRLYALTGRQDTKARADVVT
ncbi:uncharacterized protein LOC132041684, partial [Lycium ferocissimum]|uniref:uncharacterized protein LOC132041684 n=1 Tax=Lycium ferocissimum TaxID=112874 RepID=UPI0028166DB1